MIFLAHTPVFFFYFWFAELWHFHSRVKVWLSGHIVPSHRLSLFPVSFIVALAFYTTPSKVCMLHAYSLILCTYFFLSKTMSSSCLVWFFAFSCYSLDLLKVGTLKVPLPVGSDSKIETPIFFVFSLSRGYTRTTHTDTLQKHKYGCRYWLPSKSMR